MFTQQHHGKKLNANIKKSWLLNFINKVNYEICFVIWEYMGSRVMEDGFWDIFRQFLFKVKLKNLKTKFYYRLTEVVWGLDKRLDKLTLIIQTYIPWFRSMHYINLSIAVY